MLFRKNDKWLKKQKKKYETDIKILELKLQKQAYKKSLTTGVFSKRVIIFCILFTAIFALLCLFVQYKTGYDASSLLRIVAAVFGGELAMLLIKRVWTTNDEKTNKIVDSIKLIGRKKSLKKKNESNEENISTNKSNTDLSKEIQDAQNEINNSVGGIG